MRLDHSTWLFPSGGTMSWTAGVLGGATMSWIAGVLGEFRMMLDGFLFNVKVRSMVELMAVMVVPFVAAAMPRRYLVPSGKRTSQSGYPSSYSFGQYCAA
mmetsp:Transcript_51433/g.143805  ORF Transcript_51433/g.143805 Transcript_51433/m.143805 type:complete len:100 (-) Transcript_51433:187-486(-)